MTHARSERIAAAMRGLDDLGVDPELVRDAVAYLEEGPHRFVPVDPGAPRLEGVLNLRLAISHTSLDPLEVGEARAARAFEAVRTLDAAERALATTLERSSDAALRYETARYLAPPPPFTGAPLDEPDPSTLPGLVARWELVRARPEPLASFLARKLKQHFQFYRIGFGYPFYEARRLRILARVPHGVVRNEGMRETFGALEQLGPVLDNFVFDLGLLSTLRGDVAIADLVFLTMQLADELVDNLVKLGGPRALERLLAKHFAIADRPRIFVPFESLDDDALREVGIDPKSPIPKYDVGLDELVLRIAELRRAIVDSIASSRHPESTRAEVRAFFHHCFATFLDELVLPTLTSESRLDRLPLASVAWHFHRKNDEVMTRWLALRARLLGLDPNAMPEVLARWGVLLASFQIFDDLKDIAVDLGHQPSYPIELAARHHPRELAYLESTTAIDEAVLSLDRNDVMRLSVRMAGTVRDCLRLGRLLALSSYDWFLEYVADYRWRRNWLVRARSFHRAPGVDLPIERGELARFDGVIDSGVPIVDAIFRYLAATEDSVGKGELDDETLGFVLDVVGYDHGHAVLRALLPRIHAMYRFVNLRMRMTSAERASVLRRVVHVHRAASERALVGLLRATGSNAFAHRVARAFDLRLQGNARSLPAST